MLIKLDVDFSCRLRATRGDTALFSPGCNNQCPGYGKECLKSSLKTRCDSYWSAILAALLLMECRNCKGAGPQRAHCFCSYPGAPPRKEVSQ